MLKQFRLVNTKGLKALNFGGDTIPLDQIDDALAEKLIGKTHVLERVAAEPTGTTPVTLALAEASDPDKKKE